MIIHDCISPKIQDRTPKNQKQAIKYDYFEMFPRKEYAESVIRNCKSDFK
jgi:hypothetical protein